MSEALARVIGAVEEFFQGIERCRTAPNYNAGDYKDAYNRLNRLRERFLHEKFSLSLSERQALEKVFEKDVFIEGLLKGGRNIGEHIVTTKPVMMKGNQPVPLEARTSAGSYFGAPMVMVKGSKGEVHSLNHLQELDEAKRRVQAALDRAKGEGAG